MSRLNSFHLPSERWPVQGGEVLLEGPEAKHLLQVLRTPAGAVVRLFDGQGNDGLFELLSGGKKTARLRAQQLTVHPRPAAGLTLALGWNKSSRRGWLMEKGVELRAQGLAFWRAARSQGTPPPVKDSWQEKLIQSAKQCGSNWLPELACLDNGIDGLLAFGQEFDRKFLLWESPDAPVLLRPSMLTAGRCLAALGPEGGLESTEVERLVAAGFEPVTLGDSILRWETAALHCLSLSLYGSVRAAG